MNISLKSVKADTSQLLIGPSLLRGSQIPSTELQYASTFWLSESLLAGLNPGCVYESECVRMSECARMCVCAGMDVCVNGG